MRIKKQEENQTKQLLAGISAGLISLGMAGSADAALLERLGGLAYYDDVAGLTWLADADVNGRTSLRDAKGWAASLDVAGVTGWRLPTALEPDNSCTALPTTGTVYNCTGSEMGNLFYNVLGGVADASIADTGNANYDLFSNIQAVSNPISGTNNPNDLRFDFYWSSTNFSRNSGFAWDFNFNNGVQSLGQKSGVTAIRAYAWAV